MKRAAGAKQAEIEQMGQSMAALGAKLKKLSAGDKRQPQRAALTARVEREEQAKEKLRKAQAQCKHMQAQLAERTRQLQLHTSGAIENDVASPNVPRGVPRRGLGPGSVEVVKWRRSRYRLHRCRLIRLRLGAHAAIANAPRRYHRNRTAVLG